MLEMFIHFTRSAVCCSGASLINIHFVWCFYTKPTALWCHICSYNLYKFIECFFLHRQWCTGHLAYSHWCFVCQPSLWVCRSVLCHCHFASPPLLQIWGGGGALTAKAQSWSVTSQNVGIAAPPTEEGRSWPEPMYINFTDEQKNWRQKPFFLCSEQFEDFGLSLWSRSVTKSVK